MRQVLSWAFARSPGERSFACARLASFWDWGLITLNTYVGEWPDTDERVRSIVDTALGDMPCLCPPETTVK